MIERFLEQADIPYKLVAEGRWAAQLRGERKHTIPLGVALSNAEPAATHHLRVQIDVRQRQALGVQRH